MPSTSPSGADEAVLVTLAALARSAGAPVPAGVVDEARELATHGDVFDAWDEPDGERPGPAGRRRRDDLRRAWCRRRRATPQRVHTATARHRGVPAARPGDVGGRRLAGRDPGRARRRRCCGAPGGRGGHGDGLRPRSAVGAEPVDPETGAAPTAGRLAGQRTIRASTAFQVSGADDTGLGELGGLLQRLDGRLGGRAVGARRAVIRSAFCSATTAAPVEPRLSTVPQYGSSGCTLSSRADQVLASTTPVDRELAARSGSALTAASGLRRRRCRRRPAPPRPRWSTLTAEPVEPSLSTVLLARR